MDAYTHVGALLDQERQRHGLTLDELASRAHVDGATIRRLVSGHPVRIATVQVVCDALGVAWEQVVRAVAERHDGAEQDAERLPPQGHWVLWPPANTT